MPARFAAASWMLMLHDTLLTYLGYFSLFRLYCGGIDLRSSTLDPEDR